MTDDLAELYDDLPCGHLSTSPHGAIVRVNRTFAAWTGQAADDLLARRFPALLTRPGALLYETHCVPRLQLEGRLAEVALDLAGRDGEPRPILLNAAVKRDAAGAARLFHLAVFLADSRREYERDLLHARRAAEDAADTLRAQADLLARHSALLMPIQDDLRVMPVVGPIDAARGRQMLRALLDLEASGVRAVILDLTGVPTLDAAAVDTLRAAASALRLRGVHPIFSGIRPAVAIALVADGHRLIGASVRATLREAIALANHRDAPPR